MAKPEPKLPKMVKKDDTVAIPLKVDLKEKIERIYATSHYSYAVAKETNQFYSWGLGFSYVLGNGRDSELKEPHAISTKFFKEEPVSVISLGATHVVYTTGDKYFEHPDFDFALTKIQQPKESKNMFSNRKVSTDSELEKRLAEKVKASEAERKKKRDESKPPKTEKSVELKHKKSVSREPSVTSKKSKAKK